MTTAKPFGRQLISWADWSRSSLGGCRCPYCAHGILTLHRLADYPIGTSLGRVAPVAFVNVCPRCNGHVVTEAEWVRIAMEVMERVG